MTVPYLFGRTVEVSLRKRDTGEVRTWTQLATRFSLKYGARRSQNGGEVQLLNLSAESRAWLGDGRIVATVRAGYDPDGTGLTPPVAGGGDVHDIESTQSGADWTTKLKVSDGELAARSGRATLSYSSAARRDLVEAAARALVGGTGLAIGDIAAQMVGAEWDALLSDVAAEGPAGRVLDGLLPPDWTWTVMDEALVLVPPDGAVGERVLVVSPETGLVGSPKPVRSSGRSRTERGLEVRMLLDATLRPGQRIDLRARDYAGLYVVREVTHQGDTHGGDWYSDLVVRET